MFQSIWKKCCICCHCSFQLPEWCIGIPYRAVQCLIGWLYLICTIVAFPYILRKNLKNATEFRQVEIHFIGFQICFILLLVSLYRCTSNEQSYINQWVDIKVVGNDEQNSNVESKQDGKRRYCRKCEIYKPDRAHHCSSCDSCVLKMDHHCMYLNTCIGYYNYKFFILFLFWSSITCFYESYVIFYYLLEEELYNCFLRYHRNRLTLWDSSLQISIGFLISFCFAIALVVFLILHVLLLLFNTTTIEFCERRRSSSGNSYNIGIFHNVAQVFGNGIEGFFWFLPFIPSNYQQCQGKFFPHSSTDKNKKIN